MRLNITLIIKFFIDKDKTTLNYFNLVHRSLKIAIVVSDVLISIISHQGQNIRENIAAGVIIVEQSLVIRRVSRSHSGRYSCTAINAEGSGVSNTVQLRVMCKWHIENVFVCFI